MKIALIGYGKMGKEIEQIAGERGHSVSLIVDVNNMEDLCPEKFANTDLALEFTTPHSALQNILFCLENNIPLVTGTTGWKDHFPEVEKKCREKNGSLFYSSNFSPGVNVIFAVNEYLAKLMNKLPGYDIKITETHHTNKLDAPSGTAISLAEQIIQNNPSVKNWSLDENSQKDNFQIEAIREKDVIGIHEIKYESVIDYITLKHHAKTRRGLAEGAVLAAEYLLNRKGIFTMRDMLGI